MDGQVSAEVGKSRQRKPHREQRKRAVWTSDAQRPRSAITSGKKLFVDGGNPNTAWARRFQDLIIGHVNDLGGFDVLSHSQMSLIKRCASMQCELERLDAKMSNAELVDIRAYACVVGHLRRAFETLGLKRTQRDITPPTLDAYLARKRTNKPAADVAVAGQSDG